MSEPDRTVRPDPEQVKRELDAVTVLVNALAPFDGESRRRILELVDGLVPSAKPRPTRTRTPRAAS